MRPQSVGRHHATQRGMAMRSLPRVLSVIIIIHSLGAVSTLGTRAQDSTPAAGPPQEEGVTMSPSVCFWRRA